ncbi:DNA topoisomerase III [Metasolibacillus sp. FSL H7-0170]|uniref:type IA DNA topoisomerase n=1 Tax=Metasolibacillus sp. FSL H7-0170 TaxID=2921431 RepID=UPI00315965B1
MKIVILAEKPSQAKAYAEAFEVVSHEGTHITLKPSNTFPAGAIITWGIGHLVSLKMPNEYKEEWKTWNLKHLPIFPEEFAYKVDNSKKAQFNAVKKLFKEADLLINACDVDREGSNIFYSIYDMVGVKKPVKRLWINSLEVEEVRKGFANLQNNEKDLLMYQEAKGRQISDWLVGMNASQLYSLLLQEKGLQIALSVGRVQSPLCYLIYQRQKEIANFVSKPFFELIGEFKAANGVYKGKAKNIKFDTLEQLHMLLAEKAAVLNSEIPGLISSVEKEEKRTKSPKLHSLSTLQTVANKKWKYSPAKVLEVMQSLYEKKIVTYPRTDTNFITENEFAYLVTNLDAYQKLARVEFEGKTAPSKRFVDNTKVQEHYAIIPTKTVPTESQLHALTTEEKNVYQEVLLTTLAMFHSDYVYEETKITTLVQDIEFETVGKVEKSKGWKALFSSLHEATEKATEDIILPGVFVDEEVSSMLTEKEGRTSPPKPYTEGALINLMKAAGKMVEDEADSEILKEVEGIGTEATRASIIETIKKNGYIDIQKNIVHITKKGELLCDAIEGTLLASPTMTAKWESHLKKTGKGEATTAKFVENTKQFIQELLQAAPQKVAQLKIEAPVATQPTGLGTCPSCGKGNMMDRKTFLGCSEYRNGCKFSINKEIAKKKLTEKQLTDLITKGSTGIIKGFTSKVGKKFDAKLVISEGKISFKFK